MNLKSSKRLLWLDSIRGLAILFLIATHNIGALESRGIISTEELHFFQSFFRVATPLFITIFGFTFAYIYSDKILDGDCFIKIRSSTLRRLPKIFFAREIIVVIFFIANPSSIHEMVATLTYGQFSVSGEILTFYLLAVFLSPYALLVILKYRLVLPAVFVILCYCVSYYFGAKYTEWSTERWFRILFYDVYPFFPFYLCVIVGFYLAILYKHITTDKTRVAAFLSISIILVLCGYYVLNSISDNLVVDLSSSKYKAPPHPAYLSLYLGLTIGICCVYAVFSTLGIIPKLVDKVLSTIGKLSLWAYVLHYLLLFTPHVARYVSDANRVISETLIFLTILGISYFILYKKSIKS